MLGGTHAVPRYVNDLERHCRRQFVLGYRVPVLSVVDAVA